MSTFRIDQQGGGDFQTIAQALRHCLLAREKAPVLRLGPGMWREKLTLRIPGLTLEGAGAEKTAIVWGDSALMPDDAGVPLGTFRTATVRVHAPGALPCATSPCATTPAPGTGWPRPWPCTWPGTGAMWRAAPWRPSRIP